MKCGIETLLLVTDTLNWSHANVNWTGTNATRGWFNFKRGGQATLSFPELHCMCTAILKVKTGSSWTSIIHLAIPEDFTTAAERKTNLCLQQY